MFQYAEPSRQWSSFKFATIDKSLKHGTILKIGRKLTPTEDSNVEFITFKSKVVSRNHAELMIANDGTVSFRDTGSSSGSFLNRLRLSPNGRMSSWQQIRSGDIITLGVDYQGRPEEVYKAVQFKIFVTVKSQFQLLASKKSPLKLKKALLSLLAAMNNLNDAKQEYASCTECCICLCSLSPYQALFLAPCSHCFHYKCVIPLLVSESMFQCPLCRQVFKF